jgi:hypothetical protein
MQILHVAQRKAPQALEPESGQAHCGAFCSANDEAA